MGENSIVINTKTILNRASSIAVILEYLQNVCKLIGKENYSNSFIRREHSTGQGFFGVGNTGSQDCGKELIRRLSDVLGHKFTSIDSIYFRTASCLDIKQNERHKDLHRVEHTRELSDIIWPLLESKYVFKNTKIDPLQIAVWLIENLCVTLIHPDEQLPNSQYNDKKPMKKYTVPVFYNNIDFNNYTLKQICNINKDKHKILLKELQTSNWKSILEQRRKYYYVSEPKSHRLCPLEIVEKSHNSQFELLDKWYNHKRDKILFAKKGGCYDKPKLVEQYNQWKTS